MNLLTISWNAVGKEKAYLNDVMERGRLVSYSEDGEVAGDYISAWDIEAGDWVHDTYYYVNQPSWNYEDEQTGEWIKYESTWMNSDMIPMNVEMESGSSFWLYHVGEDIADFDFAGQVASGVKGYTLTGGQMNLCGNPFPTELNLADKKQVVISGATSYSEDGETAGDYVSAWDVGAGDWVHDTYYYVNQPSWNYEDEQTGALVDYTDTWMNADMVPGNTPVQVGAGFWYYAVNNGTTLSFVDPVK